MVSNSFKLILFYVSYLYFGAMVFFLLEAENEKHEHEYEIRQRRELSRVLETYLAPGDPQKRIEILKQIAQYCGKPMNDPTTDGPYYPNWTFYHCAFFALTVVTTVGYGNVLPSTLLARLFVIFYAIIGLPLNGVLFTKLGHVYWERFEAVHDKLHVHAQKVRMGLLIRWLMFLLPGFLLFCLLPALVFHHFEKWTYGVAIYYAFVTLTTIGFGDYAATFESRAAHQIDEKYYAYQVFVLVWFVLGMGYMMMIMQYMVEHYEKSKFNQLEWQKRVSVRVEFIKFFRGFKRDIQSACSILCCCFKCCTKKVKVVPNKVVEEIEAEEEAEEEQWAEEQIEERPVENIVKKGVEIQKGSTPNSVKEVTRDALGKDVTGNTKVLPRKIAVSKKAPKEASGKSPRKSSNPPFKDENPALRTFRNSTAELPIASAKRTVKEVPTIIKDARRPERVPKRSVKQIDVVTLSRK